MTKDHVNGLCYRCVFRIATREIGSGPLSRWLCDECYSFESSQPAPLPSKTVLQSLETWIAWQRNNSRTRYRLCVDNYPHPKYAADLHPTCEGCLIVAAALELRKQPDETTGAWVSVTERKPPMTLLTPTGYPNPSAKRYPVLVATKEGRVLETLYTQLGFANVNSYTDPVTHWMPLPPHPGSPEEPAGAHETLRQSLDRVRPELRDIVERGNPHEQHMCTEDCTQENGSPVISENNNG